MKTCNNGYCEYRVQNGCFWGCTYDGYCDYQAPQDSRVHNKLIEKQNTEELERKAKKAVSKSRIWTQEELDLGKREGEEMAEILKPLVG